MMEYTGKYWKMIIPLAKKSLVKRYGKEYTGSLIKKADEVRRRVHFLYSAYLRRKAH